MCEDLVMKHLITNYKRDMLILALAYLVIGIILVVYPETSGVTIAYICAGLAAFYGIAHIIAYVVSKPSYEVYRFDLVHGIAGLAVGAYIMFNPTMIMELIPIIVGCIVILDSLIKLQNALDLMRLGYKNWWFILMMSLICAFLGVLMLFYPFYTYMSLYTFVGVGMVVTACIDIISIFIVSSQVKKAYKESLNQEMEPEEQIKEIMKEVEIVDVGTNEVEEPLVTEGIVKHFNIDIKAEDICKPEKKIETVDETVQDNHQEEA